VFFFRGLGHLTTWNMMKKQNIPLQATLPTAGVWPMIRPGLYSLLLVPCSLATRQIVVLVIRYNFCVYADFVA
jgi:hypothetical protein